MRRSTLRALATISVRSEEATDPARAPKHVLGDRQVRQQGQFLEHRRYARLERLTGIRETDGVTVDANFARIGG